MTSQVLSEQLTAPAVTAWVRLLRSHAALRRELSVQLTAEHGLSINDYEALLLLARAEGGYLKRVELAEGLSLTPSGVTRLLEGLEQAGYVDKNSCATDARISYAVVTDAGRDALTRASESHLAAVRGVFEQHLDDAELQTLADLLGRLPGAGGADGESCTP
jgi:DNA-binding MarR family transcriptional regulator